MAEETSPVECDCGCGGCGDGAGDDCSYECQDCSQVDHVYRWRWLASTVTLQREAYGFEWTGDESPGQVASSLKDNVLAAAVELTGEVPREFHWKYWSHTEPFVNRDRVRDELVDVLHFIANMLIAIGVDDDELEEAYQQKQYINRMRQHEKYIASQGKEGAQLND